MRKVSDVPGDEPSAMFQDNGRHHCVDRRDGAACPAHVAGQLTESSRLVEGERNNS